MYLKNFKTLSNESYRTKKIYPKSIKISEVELVVKLKRFRLNRFFEEFESFFD